MTQISCNKPFSIDPTNLLTPKQAAIFASKYLGKNVTSNNIIYLLNYGKIANHSANPKENLIDKDELKAYYDASIKSKQDLANPLSFANFKEAETTKHIHRLHPYKGKFIPQLVEYFLDSHTDFLKENVFFHKNDIVLDPFCGSGTTLCVANELGMHAIGIDISHFNTLLSNAKIKNYDLQTIATQINKLIKILENHISQTKIIEFENTLNNELSLFNQKYFPNRDFKRAVALKNIDEKTYSAQKLQEFLPIYENLIKQFGINIRTNTEGNFFEKWYFDSIKQEILLLKNEILKADKDIQDILMIILSRTASSCRATTHSDLATLTQPINKAYYCSKHGRICKPLFSIIKWFKSYSNDTLKRLKEFNALKTNTFQICLNGDSTNINLKEKLQDSNFQSLLERQKIAGIFSSPPYVGLIDYHEQHAYAYDIFDLKRKDEYEIGRLSEGQSKNAQEKYVNKIAAVLLNARPFLKQDYNVFLVANDKFNLYEKIAKKANMQIIKRYDRAVINRSEKDKNKYSESIFHLKELK